MEEMKRVPIRVEPFSTYLERRRKGPIFPVIVAGETVYVSGLPPFAPDTGEVRRVPFERQAKIVLDQMKRCVEAAGSSLERVVKCNVYCTSDEYPFDKFNAFFYFLLFFFFFFFFFFCSPPPLRFFFFFLFFFVGGAF